MTLNRSLPQRVKNLLFGGLEKNIVFIHIPKCGGVSVGQAIRRHYLTFGARSARRSVSLDPAASSDVVKFLCQTDYPNDTDDDYPILKVRESLLLYFMGQKHVKFITGHFTFSNIAYREFCHQYAFITMLRDPVQRWISSYFYNRYKGADHRKVIEDMAGYLDSDFGRSQGYEYVKFLGGPDESRDYTSEWAIERAKRHLDHFKLVGFLEYLDLFLQQFEQQFGVHLTLERTNPNPKPKSFQESVITPEIRKEIEVICRPDLEVYHYAVDKLLGAGR